MAYWVKIIDDQKQYLVNLERVGAFCTESNKRIRFWLPETGQPIIINAQSNPNDYEKLWHYLDLIASQVSPTFWIKIYYERRNYLINLERVHTFVCDQGQRITFWLPDALEPIVLSPQSYPEIYQDIQNHIERVTGHRFF
ncbi:MAG: hypothetical protein HC920_04795 [Oscillatoriales cyanobacterium SM2_3_0]|nr:hypothetical protein [Oscillatoriales cyanobacterium SM2_3_0]